jgi:hypothetical protein
MRTNVEIRSSRRISCHGDFCVGEITSEDHWATDTGHRDSQGCSGNIFTEFIHHRRVSKRKPCPNSRQNDLCLCGAGLGTGDSFRARTLHDRSDEHSNTLTVIQDLVVISFVASLRVAGRSLDLAKGILRVDVLYSHRKTRQTLLR